MIDGEHQGTIRYRTRGGQTGKHHHAVEVDGKVHEFSGSKSGRQKAADFVHSSVKAGKEVKKSFLDPSDWMRELDVAAFNISKGNDDLGEEPPPSLADVRAVLPTAMARNTMADR